MATVEDSGELGKGSDLVVSFGTGMFVIIGLAVFSSCLTEATLEVWPKLLSIAFRR